MSDRCFVTRLSPSKALILLAAGSLLGAASAAAAPLGAIADSGHGAATGSPSFAQRAASPSQPLLGMAGARVSGGNPTPLTSGTGLTLVGATSATWGTTNGVEIKVADIVNSRPGGTSGELTLQLWASQVVPAVGTTFAFHVLGSVAIGTVAAGDDLPDEDVTSSFTPVPAGCYFVSVALLENTSGGETIVDVRTFSSGGVPEATGFDGFNFGSGDHCPAATTCTDTPTSACLLGGRFQATVSFSNAGGSGAGQVLSFGSTRAQSDESVFYFFTDPSNFEMGIKMLDACALTNTFWVFIGGLTNQGWEVNILDTATGNFVRYHNPLNTLTVTTADTAALPCP